MPKMKTKSSAKKRFKVTGTGKPSEIRDGITGRVLRGSSANLPDSERQNT